LRCIKCHRHPIENIGDWCRYRTRGQPSPLSSEWHREIPKVSTIFSFHGPFSQERRFRLAHGTCMSSCRIDTFLQLMLPKALSRILALPRQWRFHNRNLSKCTFEAGRAHDGGCLSSCSSECRYNIGK